MKGDIEDRPADSRHRNTEIDINDGCCGHYMSQVVTPIRRPEVGNEGTILGASPFEVKYRHVR